ncbi:glycogen debranching protein GlgX [Falsirhodobacter sp. 20TX0035]|uniref:glycogen debranching protein GlgX n=1 Tax=Falsirhodobacter sp. 20TX0035 TaxID=3022019 RepID=UPI00232C9C4D|nr:glycogen debranching protein GlgX [Falsirhodobacter sp. 20TX0035]MDB6453198.1 glycogen debranching protein GlgX [Falsirhodobacter sp. 20TX0035]
MNLGATLTAHGVRFAVHSAHAEAMDLCLFDPEVVVPMERQGDVWVVEVAGLGAGTEYLFRAHGPWQPDQGHWFNPDRLLLDPYAQEWTGPLRWNARLQPDAPAAEADLPRCVVTSPRPPLSRGPQTPWDRTVVYEAHVRGLSMQHGKIPEAFRGTFLGIASKPVIKHLCRLGVTAVELLPVQAFIDDRFTLERGLSNYWGYQPIGYFLPDPRYGTLAEFRHMVRSLHKAGIEVILDIVFNHTGEADEAGPAVMYRGLDNASYYRMDGGAYRNEAGTGNTLDLTQPVVQRLVMDALRFWADQGVDGFRFDLAVTLGRGPDGFDPRAAIFDMIRQDPVLRDLKLIAEPWDVADYRLGQFPPPFAEWNDRFRDDVRRFWRGEKVAGAVASRLTGSAEVFDHGRRPAWSSVNYVTAHDGFTLTDLVSYAERHNDANGEGGRDGAGDNLSDNMGTEGPDPALDAARALRRRNLLATLMLSQGTPMILAGDEMGNSQNGNNNTYAQNNPTGWTDWRRDPLTDFVARLSALRHGTDLLRQPRFLHDDVVAWYLPDGREAAPGDWDAMTTLCMELQGEDEAVFVVLNPGPAVALTLPPGCDWQLVLDTTQPASDPPEWGVDAPAHSVLVFRHID